MGGLFPPVEELAGNLLTGAARVVADRLIASVTSDAPERYSMNLRGSSDQEMDVEERVSADGTSVVVGGLGNKRKRYVTNNTLFTQTGQSILAQSGKNRIPRLLLTYGKREYPELITPFLKNLSGSGVVNNEWNGIIRCQLNIRTTFLTFFRHNMSFYSQNVGFTNQGPYDGSIESFIMTPTQATSILIAGTNGSVQSAAVVHEDQTACFAPINRSDYEDMSWNLNKLKLSSALSGFVLSPVAHLVTGAHRRVSALHQNNAVPSRNTAPVVQAPYKYNMVFNYGEVSYVFSNKGAFAANIEVILYRIKKNSSVLSNSPDGGVEAKMDPAYVYDQLITPIGVGFLDQTRDKFGTEDLDGRTPLASDVVINPRFPLLPKMKKTKQSNLPFSEVLRNKFVLPSGARRPVDIQLPGAVYDPVNIRTNQGADLPIPSGTTGLREASYYPQLDDHCYAVLIAVNGVIQTRNFHKPAEGAFGPSAVGAVDVPFLDVFGSADVQYYCSYSEHISACQYKDPGTKRLYVRGAAMYPRFTGDTDVVEEAVVLIPADQAIRTPRSDVRHYTATTSTTTPSGSTSIASQTGTKTGTGIIS